jgi:DNA-binding FrmR family transcriptional regulator
MRGAAALEPLAVTAIQGQIAALRQAVEQGFERVNQQFAATEQNLNQQFEAMDERIGEPTAETIRQNIADQKVCSPSCSCNRA